MPIWYLIRHKVTGRYLSGTEFDYNPKMNQQILSDEKHPPMLFAEDRIEPELIHRNVDLNDFEVVRAGVVSADVVEVDLTPYFRR